MHYVIHKLNQINNTRLIWNKTKSSGKKLCCKYSIDFAEWKCKTAEWSVIEMCLGWQVMVWGSKLKQTNGKLRRRERRMRRWTTLHQSWRRVVTVALLSLSQIHMQTKLNCLYERHYDCLYIHMTSRHDPPYWKGLEVLRVCARAHMHVTQLFLHMLCETWVNTKQTDGRTIIMSIIIIWSFKVNFQCFAFLEFLFLKGKFILKLLQVYPKLCLV